MLIQESYPLKNFNTFGIDANARYFASFSNTQELIKLLEECKRRNSKPFILGGGSNMLLSKDLDAFVMKNNIKGITTIKEDENIATLEVGAGEIWHEFVLHSISMGLGGLENLSLIPGSVGASPIQNIGAYGVEMKDNFISLEALNKESLEVETFTKSQCEFGYRDSIFKRSHKNKYVILSVRFELSKNSNPNTSYGAIQKELEQMNASSTSITDVSQAVINIRESKLPNPKIIGNSGSFFKNPIVEISVFNRLQKDYPNLPSYPVDENHIKLAAGWLIEQSGWKGKRVGNAGMHEKQALVLVNHGNASGEELIAVSKMVQKDVYQKFQINLEPEVNIL